VRRTTGGEAYSTRNAVGKRSGRDRDGENYYTLAMPLRAKNDGAYHTITVRLDGGEYELQYRRGYYAEEPRGQEGDAKLQPMTGRWRRVPPLSQVIFEARYCRGRCGAAWGNRRPVWGKPPEPLQPPLTRYFVDYRSIAPTGAKTAGRKQQRTGSEQRFTTRRQAA